MTIYSNGELFLGGMVTGALLAVAIVLAFYLRPVKPRRRRGKGDGESVRRAIDEAYVAGRARGREDALGRLTPRPMLTVVSRANGGWVGRTDCGLRNADCGVAEGEGGAA